VKAFKWRNFHQTDPADGENVQRVAFFIIDMDGIGYADNNRIHVSSN
jgi:hypothetical protein